MTNLSDSPATWPVPAAAVPHGGRPLRVCLWKVLSLGLALLVAAFSGPPTAHAAAPSGTKSTPAAQIQALNDLFKATGGPGWSKSTNWLSKGDPCSLTTKWEGVACITNPTGTTDVLSVSLAENGLKGSLPSTLTDLSSLMTLQLAKNQIAGSVPALPTTLQVLRLGTNDMSSPAPVTLSRLARLTILDLSNNPMLCGGKFPGAVLRLTALRRLALGGSGIAGEVPSDLTSLVDLQFLSMASNPMGGTYPTFFSSLPKLEQISLSSARLEGTLPALLASSSMKILDISSNRLEGSLPALLHLMPALGFLDVHDNRLSGTLPSTLSLATTLSSLSLASNRLSGTISDDLSSLFLLNWQQGAFNIANNSFTGTVPAFLAVAPASTLQPNCFDDCAYTRQPWCSPCVAPGHHHHHHHQHDGDDDDDDDEL